MGYLVSLDGISSRFCDEANACIRRSGSSLWIDDRQAFWAILYLLMDQLDTKGNWDVSDQKRFEKFLGDIIPDLREGMPGASVYLKEYMLKTAIPNAVTSVTATLNRIIPEKTWNVWLLRPLPGNDVYLQKGDDYRELRRYRFLTQE